MKKAVAIALLFIATTAFGQEFTFQGLQWGATKEQVIAKLGEPGSKSKNDTVFRYFVSLNGYKTLLAVSFWSNNGLFYADYGINAFRTSDGGRELNEDQVNLAFLVLFAQLVEKYGAYSEQIFNDDKGVHSKPYLWVWHFNNFHISISSILLNAFSITYYSDSAWKRNSDETGQGWVMVPNKGL